jgi:hypothetical protein
MRLVHCRTKDPHTFDPDQGRRLEGVVPSLHASNEETVMKKFMMHRVEGRARRMHDMLDQLGADRATLARLRGGQAYSEARSRCLFCRTGDICTRWLDQASSTRLRPEFCPNLKLFEACGPRPETARVKE